MSSPSLFSISTQRVLNNTSSSSIPKFRYLSAWFCPYAHRATLALEHHFGRIEYEWVQALGWYQQKEDTQTNSNSSHAWYYHWKADELKRVNPSALVPTLIPVVTSTPASSSENTDNNNNNSSQPQLVVDESKAVFESLVVMDYIDAVSKATGTDRLVSEDPYQAARQRIWTERVNRECCSPYYGVLVRQDDTERRAHFQSLLTGLQNFAKELSKTDGPLFLPNGQLSTVDLALLPWAYRYYVLEHYRGPEFSIPYSMELEAYHVWYNHVMSLESVQRTLPDKQRYLEHILKYADGSARSKVANAVRRGAAAHELDDEKDEYTVEEDHDKK